MTPLDDEHDPYGEHRGRRRHSVGPRLADITRPAVSEQGEQPKRFEAQGVPKPHQPQKRLKPEDIVPNSDNPLGTWKRFGVHLISNNLFPMESSRNILLVYFTGKQRGRMMEDMIGLIPWLILIPVDLVLHLQIFKALDQYSTYHFYKLFPMMIFTALWSIAMVSIHMRRVLRTLPLDELLMTRLSYDEIVQGLSLRPLAVQAVAVFVYFVTNLLLMTYLVGMGNRIGSMSVIILFMLVVLQYLLMSTAVELGGAMGMRAHLCIKSPVIATFKSILDLGILMGIMFICILIAGVLTGVFMLAAVILSVVGIGVIIGMAIFLALMIGLYTFFSAFLRGEASEAMQWCYNHPKEWWIAANDESIDSVERGILTPWRPLAERYRLRLPGDGFTNTQGPKPPG